MLQETFKVCDHIFANADIDFKELQNHSIDNTFFDRYENTRIVNSFLFNFSKLQDKIGAKLFKQVLYELKEIDNIVTPMIDILNLLEKLNIIDKDDWEHLREIRNTLAHEYPFDTQERIENITLMWLH